MPPRPAPPELAEFLAPFDDNVTAIAHRLRNVVLTSMPNAHEFVWDATNAISLVYSPTTRWQDGVCHIAVYTGHVNLGFNRGATLEDPGQRLQGTGTSIRHVGFRTADDTAAPWIAGYLAAAMAQVQMARGDGDAGTTIRRSAGAKRRP